MVELRPLIIVDGTLHVEGGLTKTVRKSKMKKGSTRVRTVEERDVSDDRREGNVVAANYMRKIRDLKILRTHWGALVDPDNLDQIKALIAQATRDTVSFNKLHKKCRLENTMIWERLTGPRLEAVTAWIDRRVRAGDTEVKDALALLVIAQGAAA